MRHSPPFEAPAVASIATGSRWVASPIFGDVILGGNGYGRKFAAPGKFGAD
jgi:hypothetical protein